MPLVPYLTAAAFLGAILTIQPLLNAMVGRAVGSPYIAATISLLVSTIAGVVLVGLTGRAGLTRVALTSVPWWAYLAGLVGTAFVSGSTLIAPVTGAFLFFLCVVFGQLAMSAALDHFGLFGLAVRPISTFRLCGLLFVLFGIWLAH